jgi:DNA-binding beta-propeller fold protein YncE
MHILPQLRKLERKYRDWLVVVGVHSSKFPNEKETDNIRNAILRYGIEHPVVNDVSFSIWQQYAVRAWPSLMFINPSGKVIGKHEGEFELEQIDQVLSEMGAAFRATNELVETPLPYQLEIEAALKRPLSFPGKIDADPATGRLAIADSGHNRVLMIDEVGNVEQIIGSGEPGMSDGSYQDATFNQPQGMVFNGDSLYVADAESHAIRRIDLAGQTVETIAGTGEQSLYRHEGGDGLSVPINSPYDIAVADETLYIAMAGFHQMWSYDLATNQVTPYAGDGGEDIVDGPRMAARLAQTYGITLLGDALIFADSETSSVRAVERITAENGEVKTLIGTGLFDFGDEDGPFGTAQLQHVQGITSDGERLFITDTYNHKIKVISLSDATVTTLSGSGKRGLIDGDASEAEFDEPAGIAWHNDKLYVADTNNHAIRIVDTDSGAVITLELKGLPDS